MHPSLASRSRISRLALGLASRSRVSILVIALALAPTVLFGQSITGTTGLFHIPTADVPRDRTFIVGGATIPRAYVPGDFLQQRTATMATYDVGHGYGTLVFLPGLEVMFRYTGNLGMPKEVRDRLFMDRMITARWQFIREAEWWPSLLVGIHDTGGKVVNESSSNYFSAHYVVAGKHVDVGPVRLGIHGGFAFDLFDVPTRAYDGVFGGLNVMPLGDERLELIVEHDSHRPNVAARVLLLRHVSLMAGLWNMEELSLSGGVRVNIGH